MIPAAFPGESGWSRAMTTLTHALPWMLALGLALRIASWFGWLTSVDLAAAVVILACSFATLLHQRSSHLCMRCMAEIPTDAPVQAQRRKTFLWFSHLMTTGSGLRRLLVPAIVIGLIGSHVGSPAIQHLARIPLDAILFATLYSSWLHHRLRPWCPYCRGWEDGGDPEPSPDPWEYKTRTG